jgi:hypothetical protein
MIDTFHYKIEVRLRDNAPHKKPSLVALKTLEKAQNVPI